MTMPAEVTSAADWDRLVATLRAQYAQIDELYQRITDPGEDADELDTSEEEPMADPSNYPYPGYDPDAAEAAAQYAYELAARLVEQEAEAQESEQDSEHDRHQDEELGLED